MLGFRRRHRDGTLVYETGQTGDQLVNVMLVIVIAAAIGFIGTDVTSEIDESTDTLDGDESTVTNESVGTVVFDTTSDDFFYTVSENGSSDLDSFKDNEEVYNTTSDSLLTEGTDYDWHTGNGTVQLQNTSAIGNNTNDIVITYTWVEVTNDFGDAQNNISGGFGDAMSLVDIVFIVLLFSVILAALLAFQVRST